ncbi:hypothetical protein [Streptomyces katrae]|uniref:hypothetical protein n=1 Tax=Streptomyces katrae TaxID=68223 RepID=UPI0004C25E8C|nr:hypothetical protein [Streptomyces katrae]
MVCPYCKPLLPPGRGYKYDYAGAGTHHHTGQCREVDTPWINRDWSEESADFDPDTDFDPYQLAGLTLRDTVHESDGQPFPKDAPGYKRLSSDCVEAIVVIVRGDIVDDVTPQHRDDSAEDDMSWDPRTGDETSWEIAYRVRPATPEEAEGFLLDEATGLYDGPLD